MLPIRLLLILCGILYLMALRWFLRWGTLASMSLLLIAGKFWLYLRASFKNLWRRLFS